MCEYEWTLDWDSLSEKVLIWQRRPVPTEQYPHKFKQDIVETIEGPVFGHLLHLLNYSLETIVSHLPQNPDKFEIKPFRHALGEQNQEFLSYYEWYLNFGQSQKDSLNIHLPYIRANRFVAKLIYIKHYIEKASTNDKYMDLDLYDMFVREILHEIPIEYNLQIIASTGWMRGLSIVGMF